MMFENQMKKKSVAMNGNQRRASVLSGMLLGGDVVLGQVVGELDRHLDLVRLLLAAPGDEDHRGDGQHAGEHQIEDGLVDREVDPADVDVDPGIELELVLRLEGVVLALVAEDDQQGDRDREVDPDADPDLRLACSRALARSGIHELREREAAQVDGDERERQHRGGEPVLALAEQADEQDGRARPARRGRASRRRRCRARGCDRPLASAAFEARSLTMRIACCAIQAPAADGVAEHRPARRNEDRQREREQQQVPEAQRDAWASGRCASDPGASTASVDKSSIDDEARWTIRAQRVQAGGCTGRTGRGRGGHRAGRRLTRQAAGMATSTLFGVAAIIGVVEVAARQWRSRSENGKGSPRE